MKEFALSAMEMATIAAKHVAAREGFDSKDFFCAVEVVLGLDGQIVVVRLKYTPKPVGPAPVPVVD